MYRCNCVTLKVDKMLPIKAGENNIVARSLFVLLSMHLILFVSDKKFLVESHEIFDDSKNVNTLQENKTSTSTSTSSGFVRLSRSNNTGSIREKSNREELQNQHHTYSNHRMLANDDNLSNNRSSKSGEHSLDETILDSILRPQLAVQIYTNSIENSPHQDGSDSTGSQSKSNNMANKLINTKLIVPISQQQQSHHYNHHQNDRENSKNVPQLASLMTTTNHKISNPWHYYTDPTPSSSNNNAKDNNVPDSTDDFYNHQQYDTNETPTINAIITVPHSSQSSSSQSDRYNSNNNSNRHQRIYQHDSIRQQQQQQNSDNSNSNSTSSIVSHILDDQANGNIEISMNLNGDEIIIDPISKFGRVVSINTGKENDEDSIKQTNEDNSSRNNPELTVSTGQQKYSSTSKQDKGRTKLQSRLIDKTTSGISNKALRKHISSDSAGGDQQSASEIDQINNDDNHNSNGYYSDNSGDDNPEKDNDNSSDNDLDFVKTSTSIVGINDRDDQEFAANNKPKLKDIDDEIERDEKSSGSRNDRLWSDNNSSSDKDVNAARDIQTTDESSRDDRLSSQNAYYHQNNRANNQHSIDMRTDNDNNSNNNLNNRKQQQQRRFSKPSSRQQSVLKSSGGAVNTRKAASSKRRSSYKSDDRDNSNSGIDDGSNAEQEKRRIIDKDHQDSNEKVSPVIIKGEDVRKFEQILDNLRALSLNNLALSKSRSITSKLNNKGTSLSSSLQENRLKQSNYDDSDIQNNNSNNRNDDRDDQLASQDAQAKSWNNADHNDSRQQPTNNQAKRNEASSIDSECDRRNRQRQLLQRSASGDEPAFEPDSSPNIVDQDPITSSDGSDDLNDEGSQNIEREEHSGADIHNRQQPTGVESRNQNSNQVSTDIDQLDEPKTLFVRKTILQNYYDNNGDDLDTIHESNHDARHRRVLAHEDNQSNRHVVGRSSSMSTTNREPTRVLDNYNQQQQAEKVSTPSKTNEDSTPSPGPNKYTEDSQLHDRTVNREAELVSRDKFPSRDQIDRMRSLQHLIERAAIESSQSDKPTLNFQ